MLAKIRQFWNETKLIIIAIAIAVAYFFGKKQGKENEKASQNKKTLDNMERANRARSSLNNPGSVRRLREKYTRK